MSRQQCQSYIVSLQNECDKDLDNTKHKYNKEIDDLKNREKKLKENLENEIKKKNNEITDLKKNSIVSSLHHFKACNECPGINICSNDKNKIIEGDDNNYVIGEPVSQLKGKCSDVRSDIIFKNSKGARYGIKINPVLKKKLDEKDIELQSIKKDSFVIKEFKSKAMCGKKNVMNDPNTISLNPKKKFTMKKDGNVSEKDCSNLVQIYKKDGKAFGLFRN